MFVHKSFDDVVVKRRVYTKSLAWPVRGEAVSGRGMGGNRDYIDLRNVSWCQAKRVYEAESEIIARIEASADPESEYHQIERELFEAPALGGLDVGVASSVVALAAAGCVPFSSCNAGSFGGEHREAFPLVVCCAKSDVCSLLVACAKEGKSGLQDSEGYLIAYADDVRKLRDFAHNVIMRGKEFSALRSMRVRDGAGERQAFTERARPGTHT